MLSYCSSILARSVWPRPFSFHPCYCLQLSHYLEKSQRAKVHFFPFICQLLPYLWATPLLTWKGHLNRTPGVTWANKQPSIPTPIPILRSTGSLPITLHSFPNRFQSGLNIIPNVRLLGQESPRLLFKSHDFFQGSSIWGRCLPLFCSYAPSHLSASFFLSLLNTSLLPPQRLVPSVVSFR